jgi:hypothetical protein
MKWVRIFCDGEKLIDSARLIAVEPSDDSQRDAGFQRKPIRSPSTAEIHACAA